MAPRLSCIFRAFASLWLALMGAHLAVFAVIAWSLHSPSESVLFAGAAAVAWVGAWLARLSLHIRQDVLSRSDGIVLYSTWIAVVVAQYLGASWLAGDLCTAHSDLRLAFMWLLMAIGGCFLVHGTLLLARCRWLPDDARYASSPDRQVLRERLAAEVPFNLFL
jgi:hypothetical protein